MNSSGQQSLSSVNVEIKNHLMVLENKKSMRFYSRMIQQRMRMLPMVVPRMLMMMILIPIHLSLPRRQTTSVMSHQ